MLMTNPKLLDEITVTYDVATGIEDKLQEFLSLNDRIGKYLYTIEDKIYKIFIEIDKRNNDNRSRYSRMSRSFADFISLMSHKSGGRYFLIERQEDFYGEFLTYDKNYRGLYFQLTFKFPN